MLRATCKVDFELSWQILAYWISEKESGNCFCIRSRIKFFIRTDPCKMATHDIPDCVSTGLSCRESYLNETTHYLAYIFKLYPMKLNVLTSRNMSRTY